MKNKRRIVSLLLAMAMFMSSSPIQAVGEDGLTDGGGIVQTDNIDDENQTDNENLPDEDLLTVSETPDENSAEELLSSNADYTALEIIRLI